MNILSMVVQEAAEHGAEAAEHTPNVFSLSLGVSFWTWVIFIILFAVLAKFAFPAILGYAAAREQRIQDALDAAARERAEAERLVAEQKKQLTEARQHGQQLLAEARQGAERLREEMLAQARTDQQEMLERARQEIDRERERALESLRRDAVDLAMAAAARLLERRVDAETDRRLVEEYLDQVEAGRATESV